MTRHELSGPQVLSGPNVVEVPCTLDLEQTGDSLHAYCELDGRDPGPGDEVLILDAPSRLVFGEKAVVARRALVRRAGPLARLRARVEGYLELTELYEVSFSEGRAP